MRLAERSLVPRLAIVVSALGSIESLEGTLVSVLENRPADCEILVVLNEPYADPYDLKDEVQFVWEGRASSINRALAATRAPFVHLLASGCQVIEGWAEAALARFGDRRVGSVAPLAWDAARQDRIFAAGVGYCAWGRRYLVGQGLEALDDDVQRSIVGPGRFAAFYRKAALDFVGGLSARLEPQQADADLGIMLRRAGFSVAIEARANVLASHEADPAAGALHQAISEERLFWRNVATSGDVLAHAGMITLELVRSFPRPRMLAQFAGRLWAGGEIVAGARHRRALRELGARALRTATPGDHTRIDRLHEAPARLEAGRTRIGSR
jgi:hypothetical protein